MRVAAAILSLLALAACGDDPATEGEGKAAEAVDRAKSAATRVQDEASRLGAAAGESAEQGLEHLTELYQASVQAGDTAATSVYAWIVEDLRKVGAWDYQVVRVDTADDASLSRRLNELGDERWEVLWLEPVAENQARVYVKRRRRSRLQRLADRDYVELAPVHDEDPAGDGDE